MPRLDDGLLKEFMETFYGYGNIGGDYWLVGMEEGGGHSCDEVNTRLQAWERRGKRMMEDVAEYHRAFGVTKLFEPHPNIQPTWGKLIRMLLAADGIEHIDADRVRDYQRDHFARPTSNHCVLELLPLPSPSTNHWIYSGCSELPYLANRDHYRTFVAPYRIAHLQGLIEHHRPPYVIFYSFGYRLNYWEKIAGVALREHPDADCALGRRDETMFVVMKHPATKGVTGDYYQRMGRMVRRR
jgi:hypothetical protein